MCPGIPYRDWPACSTMARAGPRRGGARETGFMAIPLDLLLQMPEGANQLEVRLKEWQEAELSVLKAAEIGGAGENRTPA